ncbi:MAG TPA: hypothetical protein V6D17_00235 [Candidatus Obscuribacterales bacterium]
MNKPKLAGKEEIKARISAQLASNERMLWIGQPIDVQGAKQAHIPLAFLLLLALIAFSGKFDTGPALACAALLGGIVGLPALALDSHYLPKIYVITDRRLLCFDRHGTLKTEKPLCESNLQRTQYALVVSEKNGDSTTRWVLSDGNAGSVDDLAERLIAMNVRLPMITQKRP